MDEVIEPMDFDIVKEPWSIYKLKDVEEVLLKGRTILEKVEVTRLVKEQRIKGIGIRSHNVFVTFAPASMKGIPSKPLPQIEQISEHEKKPIPFDVIGQDHNIYLLKNGLIIRIRLIVTQVSKTLHFTVDGDPFYIVSSQVVTEVSGPAQQEVPVLPESKS